MPETVPLRVAYLAPEIPALSATFVYNEILECQKQGLSVISFSVHQPNHAATEATAQVLTQKTCYLYQLPARQVIAAHCYLLSKHPGAYFGSLSCLLKDMLSLRVFTRTAVGLVYRFFYAAPLAKKLMVKQVQHLHIHFAHIPTDIGMYASKMSGIPFSVMAHANDIFERGYLLRQKAERSAFFATISEYNRRFLIKKGLQQTKLKLIRCGVDTHWQTPRSLSSASDHLVIGTVGRLVEKKGNDVLLDAIATLKQQGLSFQLKIAGDGPLSTLLKQQVERLQIGDIVEFVGALPHDEIAQFISNLDLFVLACKQDAQGDMDGIPVVLMEAMLSGVPVISTELSGIPELVIDQQTGLIVPPENPALLAAAIQDMTENTSLRQRLIRQAEDWVNKEFRLDKNVQRLQDLIIQSRQTRL